MRTAPKLSEFTNNKNNNFNLLRLFAAILVLFSHCYPLIGMAQDPLEKVTHNFDTFGGIAVSCFFVISGFLITRSYLQHNNFFAYLRARVIRIFPALLVVILFTAFIIGPWVTTLSFSEYFYQRGLYAYVVDNAYLHMNYYLPGVFATNPLPNAVNGSLWSLPFEFAMYLLVACAGLFHLLRYRVAALMMLVVIFLGYIVALNFGTNHSHMLQYLLQPAHLDPFLCFAMGSIAYLWRDKIVLHAGIILGLLAMLCLIHNPSIWRAVFFLTFAYSILWFAYQRTITVWSYQLTAWGDFSYGIYIYAFPVQQTVMHFGHLANPWSLFLTALPITYVFAMASWYVIEKPALSFKATTPPVLQQSF